MSDELQLVELLAARLCHDLIGPVGAIVNGVELLGDGAGDAEVTAMIGDAARRASRRLQVYRVAYGSAASLSATRRIDDSRRLIQALCETQPNLNLDWPAVDDATEQAAGRAYIKVAMILAMIGAEALPRGGALRVRHTVQPSGRIAFRVVAEGQHAKLPDDVQTAFAPSPNEMPSPKAVPIVLARRLANAFGGTISVSAAAADRVEMRCEMPAGA